MNAVAGSPLAARQSALPYTILLATGIVIGFLFVIWILSKMIKKVHQSPEYIAKMKGRQTMLTDVQALVKKIGLTKAEGLLLFNICTRQQARNIFYSWNEADYLDEIFCGEYRRLRQKGEEETVFSLFRLRTHLEKILTLQRAIPSSHSIPEGAALTLPVSGGRVYSFKIEKNEKDSLSLRIPPNLEGTEFCPKPLSKIIMTFMSKDSVQYVLSTRVIRFQNAIDMHRQMIIQHSNTVSMQNRRQYKRAGVGVKCRFSAVDETKGKRGEIEYRPKENKYEGLLADISAGGCMIQTNLPIKRDQKLWIKISLPGLQDFEAYGLIVSSQKNVEKELFSLHIAFIGISSASRNDIFSYVYKYA